MDSPLLVKDPLPAKTLLQHRQAENDDKEHKGNRRSVAKAHSRVEVVEHQDRSGCCRSQGASELSSGRRGHDKNVVKVILKPSGIDDIETRKMTELESGRIEGEFKEAMTLPGSKDLTRFKKKFIKSVRRILGDFFP